MVRIWDIGKHLTEETGLPYRQTIYAHHYPVLLDLLDMGHKDGLFVVSHEVALDNAKGEVAFVYNTKAFGDKEEVRLAKEDRGATLRKETNNKSKQYWADRKKEQERVSGLEGTCRDGQAGLHLSTSLGFVVSHPLFRQCLQIC